MTDDSHSTPAAGPEMPTSHGKAAAKVLRLILKYLASYLFGIATCVLVTPVELELAGVVLWPYYPVFAVIGFFLFYFHFSRAYLPSGGSGFGNWLFFAIGFSPLVFEAAAYFTRLPRLSAWRPLWLGFPVGFVGTLGVFYAAAASI